MVPADEFYAKKNRGVKRSSLPSPMVMGDIKPFLNVAIDGREISSRSHKREMMRQHSLVEAGDMKPQATRKLHKPKGIRASMKRSLQQLGA
jgi:hypothetical protein